MSSNNSLPNLTHMITRKCNKNMLPGQEGLPSLGDDVPTAWVTMSNDSYGGMAEICHPNYVNLFECALWCELPTSFMAAYEESGSDLDGFFLRELRKTGMNMSAVGIFSVKETSAASVANRPLSMMGLGTLALGMFIALNV